MTSIHAESDKLRFPPLITLEEHFFSVAASEAPSAQRYNEQLKNIPGLLDKLKDLGSLRLESMNKNDITMQIISHGPTQPILSPSDCRAANLQLHEAICTSAETRERFAGFAVLPMNEPDEAAKELAYCVEELGFVGALIDNHANGTTYEGPSYRSFWYTVQSLGVPIYIHPTWSTEQQRKGVFPDLKPDGNGTNGGIDEATVLSGSAVESLMASSWGWHSDVAMHIFKLFASGTFDKFPRLKLIVGHFGEMIPFMLDRTIQLSPRWNDPPLRRNFKTVYDENLWITTSGIWSLDPLRCILANTKKDHILFSVDYPFAQNESGKKWMNDLLSSGLCDQETIDMVGYKNSEKLLGVRTRRPDEERAEDDKLQE
ncbi:hypothetical protein LTR64_001866 [Lithohypha guttulata]|uniref:uncharacterized protein n=1 Tax=Lithohypha guttulata TaxID=1690604 RepID=UPI002DDFEAED|nr:hypothetical protein LTR51_007725 [Lithohypha guttulata]